MEATEQRGVLKTCLIVGGTVLSCSLGVIAFRRLRKMTARTDEVHTRRIPEYEVKPTDQRTRKTPQERHDGISTNRPALFSSTQTFEEVTINIPVAPDVKSKDVRCIFNTESLEINVKSLRLLKSFLHQKISPGECSWKIEGEGASRVLTISLVKGTFQQGHWTQVLVQSDDE